MAKRAKRKAKMAFVDTGWMNKFVFSDGRACFSGVFVQAPEELGYVLPDDRYKVTKTSVRVTEILPTPKRKAKR